MALSTNETIQRYVDYYDDLWLTVQKKKLFKFNRRLALRVRNMETIIQFKPEKSEEQLIKEPKQTNKKGDKRKASHKDEGIKGDESAKREENAELGEVTSKKSVSEDSKLWQVIQKQRTKVASRTSYVKKQDNTPNSDNKTNAAHHQMNLYEPNNNNL